MVNASNSDKRQAASSNLCEEVVSSATDHAELLEHNIEVILQDQDVRQCHLPGEQNRNEDCHAEVHTQTINQGQFFTQSLSLD